MVQDKALIEPTQALKELKAEMDTLFTEIGEIKVTNDDELMLCDNMLKRVKGFLKGAKQKQTADLTPVRTREAWLRKAYNELLHKAYQAEANLTKAYNDYVNAKEEARKAEQRRLDAAAQRSFDHKVDKGETPVVPEPVAKKAEPVISGIKSDQGTSYMRTNRTWDYANEAQKTKTTSSIPDEYWIPPQVNEKLVTAAVKGGIMQIPGIVISESKGVVVR